MACTYRKNERRWSAFRLMTWQNTKHDKKKTSHGGNSYPWWQLPCDRKWRTLHLIHACLNYYVIYPRAESVCMYKVNSPSCVTFCISRPFLGVLAGVTKMWLTQLFNILTGGTSCFRMAGEIERQHRKSDQYYSVPSLMSDSQRMNGEGAEQIQD